MQILRNEIRTGILVILTIGLTVGIVLYLSAPGLFRPVAHYRVFFDDAAAIKPGASVLLAGRKIGTVEKPRRPGDPPRLIASSEKIKKELGWQPQFQSLDAIVKSAWKWHLKFPRGYEE